MFFEDAHAKLNLGLHVLRRRKDGFHDIETIMVRIGWSDRLRISEADQIEMTSSSSVLPVDERNLCVRALYLLARSAGVTSGAHIHLDKQIPVGAGLGGGSSDAAAALHLGAKLWKLKIPAQVMMDIAANLGSDVPFFLGPRVALAQGRGELIRPVIDDEFPFHIVVVMPDFSISTQGAYAMVRPSETDRPDLLEAFRSKDLGIWKAQLTNDFEIPLIRRYPEIQSVKNRLEEAGAGYTSLSGSGAAVFGLFEEPGAARSAGADLRESGYVAWCGRQE